MNDHNLAPGRIPRLTALLIARLTGNARARDLGEFFPDQSLALSLVVSLGWGSTLSIVVAPFAVRSLVDSATSGRRGAQLIIPLGLILAVGLLENAVSAYRSVVIARLAETTAWRIRERLHRKVLALPHRYFTQAQQGRLLSLFGTDISNVQFSVAMDTATVVAVVVDSLLALVVVLALDWKLTLVALALGPVVLLLPTMSGRRMGDLAREQLGTAQQLMEQTVDTTGVAGALNVRLFGRQQYEQRRYRDAARRLSDVGVRRIEVSALLRFAVGSLSFLAVVLALAAGVWWISTGATSVGTLAAFSTALFAVYQPWSLLADARTRIAAADASIERLYSLLDEPEAPVGTAADAGTAAPVVTGRPRLAAPAIQLADVWFTYAAQPGGGASGERWALRGVSVSIPAGHTVALVGASGAGKSTLGYLVGRILSPAKGQIRLDGADLAEIPEDELRRIVGQVPQDPYLTNDTVAANLRYGSLEAGDDQLWEALSAVGLAKLVRSLPGGLDYRVGARGHSFSGGERQRMAIARILLQNPPFLVLDEATSQLDTVSEALVTSAVQRLSRERTCLIIAHRLSTVRDADHIVVLQDGQVAEAGTHDELLRAGGAYARLYARISDEPQEPADE